MGKILQESLLTAITYYNLLKDFLLPILFFQKLIAHMYKDIWSNHLANEKVWSAALWKLYLSHPEVSADCTQFETILAIHKISKHVRPGHFNRIGNHISDERISQAQESERQKLKAHY